VRIALFERGPRLGGNHTWCFHADDVGAAALEWVAPLVGASWPGYRVRFPTYERALSSPYAAVTSDRFDEVVAARLAAAPGCVVRTNAEVVDVAEHVVRLAGGERVAGQVVVDARGPAATPATAHRAYQKFIGHELALARPHGLTEPILMDFTVPQDGGLRFVYVLPLAADRVLVEDTYLCETPALDAAVVRARIDAYARARFQVAAVLREESGVLPLPLDGEHAAPERGPLRAGFQGGWFHPVTGYSFPVALRLAEHVAATPPEELFGAGLARLAAEQQRQLRFCHRLNRMLFSWFEPPQRYNVLARFYRLPEATIRRFYALRLSGTDRFRILAGRPPRGMSWRAALGRSPIEGTA
jgi:lycopene beta-cyclase